ncbi:DUF6894 family protein [Lichenifustis flavocetrariae]|uniref:DUF6894 domain-containing protein n=1 Tax=Lichenifustis flavocetrariae TaxID=2949735 RepID=A0AA41YYJ1_9HYPH|nr:hypothetical protein [Lichenifustis flavocetrariae]MCW6510464.1 hypothetical protein [Lichenifustis flavocetrariae]
MTRYFFHVCNGEHIEDKLGMELAGLQDARLEAIQRIGRFITEHPDQCCTTHDWRMEVTDLKGLLMFRLDLDLTMVESPSTGR